MSLIFVNIYFTCIQFFYLAVLYKSQERLFMKINYINNNFKITSPNFNHNFQTFKRNFNNYSNDVIDTKKPKKSLLQTLFEKLGLQSKAKAKNIQQSIETQPQEEKTKHYNKEERLEILKKHSIENIDDFLNMEDSSFEIATRVFSINIPMTAGQAIGEKK